LGPLGRGSRQIAEEFSWRSVAKQYLRLYEKVLQRSANPEPASA